MPLKLAAVLQRSKDHPDQINNDILDYYDTFTHGNRYVALNLDEDPDNLVGDFEGRLIDYVKEMGFDDSSIILVDKQWDVEPEEVDMPNGAIAFRNIPPLEVNPEDAAPGQIINIPVGHEVFWVRN